MWVCSPVFPLIVPRVFCSAWLTVAIGIPEALAVCSLVPTTWLSWLDPLMSLGVLGQPWSATGFPMINCIYWPARMFFFDRYLRSPWHVYMYMWLHMHIHIHKHIHIHIHIHTYIHTYIYINIYIYFFSYLHIYMCIYIHVYISYIHNYISYIHIYIYT